MRFNFKKKLKNDMRTLSTDKLGTYLTQNIRYSYMEELMLGKWMYSEVSRRGTGGLNGIVNI